MADNTDNHAKILIAILSKTVLLARKTFEAPPGQNFHLIIDEAIYFPDSEGIVVIVAFLNTQERAEQVIGAELILGSIQPMVGLSAIQPEAAPPALQISGVEYMSAAFPVRVKADEAIIRAMFFPVYGYIASELSRLFKVTKTFRAEIRLQSLRSTFRKELAISEVSAHLTVSA